MKDGTPATKGSAGAGRRGRLAGRLAGAAVVLGVFGYGALLLADYLRVRERVAAGVRQRAPQRPGLRFVAADDPLLRTWMPATVSWQRVREVAFGADRAWFVTGTSRTHPKVVFESVLRQWQPESPVAGRTPAELLQLSAAGLMRMHVSVGILRGTAFLSRVPPDPAAAAEGRFAFEPGGTLMAFARDEQSWEYVCWTFPDGLDLGAYMQRFGAPRGLLDRVAAGVERHLEPTLAVGLGPTPGAIPLGTVYCRARGHTAEAMRAASAAFVRAGWRQIREEVSPRGDEIRILSHEAGDRNVWLATSQRETQGGFVTVMLGTP